MLIPLLAAGTVLVLAAKKPPKKLPTPADVLNKMTGGTGLLGTWHSTTATAKAAAVKLAAKKPVTKTSGGGYGLGEAIGDGQKVLNVAKDAVNCSPTNPRACVNTGKAAVAGAKKVGSIAEGAWDTVSGWF